MHHSCTDPFAPLQGEVQLVAEWAAAQAAAPTMAAGQALAAAQAMAKAVVVLLAQAMAKAAAAVLAKANSPAVPRPLLALAPARHTALASTQVLPPLLRQISQYPACATKRAKVLLQDVS